MTPNPFKAGDWVRHRRLKKTGCVSYVYKGPYVGVWKVGDNLSGKSTWKIENIELITDS